MFELEDIGRRVRRLEERVQSLDLKEAEQDAGEWVELPPELLSSAEVQVSPDGERWRTRYANEEWQSNPVAPRAVVAYRAGLAQGQKVRDEAVKTLLHEVQSANVSYHSAAPCRYSVPTSEWVAIQAAARAVEP